MATFTNITRNTASFSNTSRNTATFMNLLRKGTSPQMSELANYTFESVVFSDGTQLKNVTFDQLTQTVWANVTRNT